MATSDEYEVRDQDRLPWLETVDDEYDGGTSIVRIAVFVLLGLAVIAALIFATYSMKQRVSPGGNGALIAAQEGDYKVKPDNPGGMKVEGEGDTAFATSEGKTSGNASIDLKAVLEAPINGQPAKPKAVANGAGAVPPSAGRLAAPAPVARPGAGVAAAASGGALVQLGSFPDEASANLAWARASKRFGYLAPLGKSVQSASVGGKTVYRLRVNAGSASQASELCSKLKIAGEACFIPRN